MKKLLLISSLLMLSAFTGFSQQQDFAVQQWASSTGAQNFFYKNITKTDGTNTYTAGATLNSSGNYDLLLVKYNSHGGVIWTKQYNGAGNGQDMATGLHIDGSGNVYVTGTTYVNGTNFNDIITIKYNSAGTQQWLSTYNGSGSSYDAGGAILVDAAGSNVYICGGAMTTSNLSDFIAIKYSASTGSQTWASTYNYNGNYDVAAKLQLVTVGLSTTLKVSGGVQHNSTTWKYATVTFNISTGAQIGSASVSGSNTGTADELGDVCTDASQTYSYLAASINNTGTGYDYKIVKLQNSDLTIVWERTWNGADSLDDKAADVIVDASGNVYVTGFTTTDTQDKNYATVKYNSGGTLQWVKYHNGAGNGRDEGTAINVDASNNVYVTGTSNTGSSLDYYTIKYKPDNTTVWEKSYNGLYNGLDKPYDIALDAETNSALISGQTQTATGYSYTIQKLEQATTVFPATDEALSSSFSYTENLGQLLDTDEDPADDIDFYSHSSSPSMYFQNGKISYVLSSIDTLPATDDTLHRVDITFPVSKRSDIMGMTKRSDYNNYYLAHIPEGRAHVTNYSRLISPNMYDNIDRILGSNSAGFTMRFVCKPGSNPGQIKLSYAGADSIRIVSNDLIIYTKLGIIKHPRLTAKLVDNAGAVTTLGWLPSYVRTGTEITFSLGGLYDTAKNLVLEMGFSAAGGGGSNYNLDWCTYYGRDGNDLFSDAAVDDQSNLFVTGYTLSDAFPTVPGSYSTVSGDPGSPIDYDLVVAKFSEIGELLSSTYVAGTGNDEFSDIDIDGNNRPVISAQSSSPDFPIEHSGTQYYDDELDGNTDIVVFRLSSNMQFLEWSTFYGGDGDENSFNGDIVIDREDNIYVAGDNSDTGTPFYDPNTGNYYEDSYTGTGFIVKFNDLLERTWATQFGPTNTTVIAMTIAEDDKLVITGGAGQVSGFPLADPGGFAYDVATLSGARDIYFAWFDDDNDVYWSGFYGGNGNESPQDIKVNSTGMYIVGITYSNNLPTVEYDPGSSGDYYDNTYETSTNWGDAVLLWFRKFGPIKWATYFGGAHQDHGVSIQLENTSLGGVNMYVAGHTQSPTIDIEQLSGYYYQPAKAGGVDVWLSRFSDIFELEWSTYFGGLGDEEPNKIITDDVNHFMYMVGYTQSYSDISPPFPTEQLPVPAWWQANKFDPLEANTDGYIGRFNLEPIVTDVKETMPTEKDRLFIYPNPFSEQFVLMLPESMKNAELFVYDSFGRLLFTKEISEAKSVLDMSVYPAGIYYVQVKDNLTTYSSKIIKQ